MYSYNTHNTTSLQFGIKFRTTSTTNDAILFSKDGPTTREWVVLQQNIGGEQYLSIGLFKTNAVFQLIRITADKLHNNGKWHTLSVNWNSNGAGAGGVLSVTFDGVTTNYDTPTIDSIQQGAQRVCLSGRDGGYGPIAFDCEYVSIGDKIFSFSSVFGDKVYSQDGIRYFQSVGQTLTNVWKKDSTNNVYPYNMVRGGYRYTNGTSSQDIILPNLLEKFRYNSGGTGSGLFNNEVETWNLKFKTEWFGVSKNLDFRFMLKDLSPSNGYGLYITQNSDLATGFVFRKYVNGAESNISLQYVYKSYVMGVDANIDIVRNPATGNMKLYYNGDFVVEATDTDFTTSTISIMYNQRHYIISASAGSTPFSLTHYDMTYLGLPSYTSHTVLAPLSFNNCESAFKIPYNSTVKKKDTGNKIYTDESPNNVFYTDLVNGGFGNKIKYKQVTNGYRSFIVKM